MPAARLEQLLADRDSAAFKTRLKADKELTKLGPLAEEALRAEAEKPRSEDVRAAVETLLARLSAEVLSGWPRCGRWRWSSGWEHQRR